MFKGLHKDLTNNEFNDVVKYNSLIQLLIDFESEIAMELASEIKSRCNEVVKERLRIIWLNRKKISSNNLRIKS